MLVFGSSGQVAREFHKLAPDANFVGRAQVDLGRPADCAAMIRDVRPATVVNLAAYTAVDRAEDNEAEARLVNTEAPAAMAAACAGLGVPFLTVSTDYVFDGTGDHPRDEAAPTGPLGVYGATKLAGEQAVAAAGGQWAVLRTSWVFSSHGSNFVRTMLRLGADRDEIAVVADQIGGPTPAAAIAAALSVMAGQMSGAPGLGGIYHFAGAPDVSWAGFAREIFARSGIACRVRDIASADYPTAARRPLNSRLDCTRIQRDFGIARPDWRVGLTEVLAELET